ncbi:peptidase inhibitor family I36 protein [Wangella sp. NEAU-J3]|nr:peptidase inhibitor family I36 protein [Jidongwangia harbinensis]
MCTWSGFDYSGTFRVLFTNGTQTNCARDLPAFKSYQNLAGRNIRIYSGTACGGTYTTVPPNQYSGNFDFTARSSRWV